MIILNGIEGGRGTAENITAILRRFERGLTGFKGYEVFHEVEAGIQDFRRIDYRSQKILCRKLGQEMG